MLQILEGKSVEFFLHFGHFFASTRVVYNYIYSYVKGELSTDFRTNEVIWVQMAFLSVLKKVCKIRLKKWLGTGCILSVLYLS